ncbi:hypothetical protein Q3G72_028826 [Acer saccharum]|nr:hypothetical protein Q3G72_028826 [Acer saccharum]
MSMKPYHLRLIPDGLTVRSLLVLAPVLWHSVRASTEPHTLTETKMRFALTVKFVLQINCPGKSCWQVLQFRLSVLLKSNLFVGLSVSSFGLVEV